MYSNKNYKKSLNCSKNPLPDKNIIDNAEILYVMSKDHAYDWEILVRLVDNRYAFVVAHTDHYTGFEIGGDFSVYVYDSLTDAVNFGMTHTQYESYIENTISVDTRKIKKMAITSCKTTCFFSFSEETFVLRSGHIMGHHLLSK